MKKTPLYETHVKLGAKMAAFGGFEMPIQYTNAMSEHLSVRSSVGVFDVSHMGEFLVEGNEAFKLLQRICSNDISLLKPGKAQYNYFPNGNGGVVDDLIVYQLAEKSYLLVVNASNIKKDWDWITLNNKNYRATLTDQSEQTALLAIQGPKAVEAMRQLTSIDLKSLPFYSHISADFAGHSNILIATTGYTGAGGIEIYCPKENVEPIWESVMNTGAEHNIVPVGLAARDSLRLEMGYCLYGNEIDDSTSPIAAGLGWITKPETHCIDAERLAKQKNNGTSEKLIGFIMKERGIPRKGYEITNASDIIIGRVTSGTQSPVLSCGIGLGYVNSDTFNIDEQIHIKIRDKNHAAKIATPPFIEGCRP